MYKANLVQLKIIINIICLLFYSYIQLTLSVCYLYTTSVEDLGFLCERNFPTYIEPIKNGELTINDTSKLWKRFESFLRNSAQLISLKELGNTETSVIDIPLIDKVLLISAYLASYNPAKCDKRFLLKNSVREYRRARNIKKDVAPTGPKAFTFERLIHIFRIIMQLNFYADDLEKDLINNNVLSELESLLDSKLIRRLESPSTGPFISSITKYIISETVTFQYCNNIAESIDFDLKSHLLAYSMK